MNFSIENFPERECPEKTCPEMCECPETTCPVLECPEISCPACESNIEYDRKNEQSIQKICDENDNLAEHGFVEETNPIDFKEGDLFLQKNKKNI